MKILDSSALNYIFDNNLTFYENYYITPDIKDELFVLEFIKNKKAPTNIKNIFDETFVDELLYLKNYRLMLNKHRGRSFFNMGGFGDISIITLVKTLVDMEKKYQSERLPMIEFEEKIIVYLDDKGLRKRIKKEVGDVAILLLPKDLQS